MNIPDIGNYLRAFRKSHKKTLQDVADAIDATSSYVSQIEKGVRNPSDETLGNILVKAFEVEQKNAEVIIKKWRVKQYSSSKTPELSALKAHDKTHGEKLPEGACWIDELPLLPYHKKLDANFEFTDPDAYWPFPVSDPKVLGKYFLCQMDDDSMEPKIPQNALLVVDRNAEDIPYQSVVLAITDEKINFRFYEKREDKIKLVPANSKYPVFLGEEVKIIGKVIQMVTDI
jgi:SOS-response transcriptional repressor LexA